MTAPLSLPSVSINPQYVQPPQDDSGKDFISLLLQGVQLRNDYLSTKETNALRKQELDAKGVEATRAQFAAEAEGEAIVKLMQAMAGDQPGGAVEMDPDNFATPIAGTLGAMPLASVKGAFAAISPHLDLQGTQVDVLDDKGQPAIGVRRGATVTIVKNARKNTIDPDAAAKRMNAEFNMADRYQREAKVYKDYADAIDGVRRSVPGSLKNIAASQVALLFQYMKLLDPSSTVREGELAMAEDAKGVPARILNTYNKIISGARLTPQQVREFAAQAEQLARGKKEKQDGLIKQYTDVARNNGLNAANIVYDYFGGPVKNEDKRDDDAPIIAPAAPGQPGNPIAVMNKLRGKKP